MATVAESALKQLHESPLVKPQVIADLTGANLRTVQNMCVRGELKAVRVGRLWRVNSAAALAKLGLE